jgi:ribonuclease HII
MLISDSPDPCVIRLPDFSNELQALGEGATRVAGIDEAGRGPLAGPVVVAAVVFAHGRFPKGLDDSKKLTAKCREALFGDIIALGEVSVVVAPPSIIDTRNIRGATLWAMRQALMTLPVRPDLALIDGRDVPPDLPCPGRALIGGDGRSVSIAAASIVAKVMRDSMCPVMDRDAEGYGFAGHKGYGTAAHMSALSIRGASLHHRRSFAPVALTFG